MTHETKLHPLHSREWVAQYVLATGHYPGVRRTGRTTVAALKLIAKAIENPGMACAICDHQGGPNANAADAVEGIIRKLALERMEVSRHGDSFLLVFE